jgi:hypothetical protein
MELFYKIKDKLAIRSLASQQRRFQGPFARRHAFKRPAQNPLWVMNICGS